MFHQQTGNVIQHVNRLLLVDFRQNCLHYFNSICKPKHITHSNIHLWYCCTKYWWRHTHIKYLSTSTEKNVMKLTPNPRHNLGLFFLRTFNNSQCEFGVRSQLWYVCDHMGLTFHHGTNSWKHVVIRVDTEHRRHQSHPICCFDEC